MDGLALTILAALGTALVLGAVAHRLGQSPMIGYIAAGLLVGPFTPGYVADRGQVQALADIGVALLMFSIGLRFRLAELAEVGRAVLIGAPIQVAISLGLGTLAALLVGRTPIQAVFLGAVVSVCSSVVLVRVAGERTLETTLHGRLALGWSIVQDLLTVVLVVALAVMAEGGTRPILGAALATAVAVGFVVAVVVLGSRILPAAMSRIALLGSRELFVVAVAVIALGTATLAQAVGVSVALGAFLAGLALADSDLAASVLGEVVPLRELFATIFFVSVGILLEPAAIVAGWPIVLLLLVLIVAGKALPMAALLRLAGHHWGPRCEPPASWRREASSASYSPRWACDWVPWTPPPSAKRWGRSCSRSWWPARWRPRPASARAGAPAPPPTTPKPSSRRACGTTSCFSARDRRPQRRSRPRGTLDPLGRGRRRLPARGSRRRAGRPSSTVTPAPVSPRGRGRCRDHPGGGGLGSARRPPGDPVRDAPQRAAARHRPRPFRGGGGRAATAGSRPGHHRRTPARRELLRHTLARYGVGEREIDVILRRRG